MYLSVIMVITCIRQAYIYTDPGDYYWYTTIMINVSCVTHAFSQNSQFFLIYMYLMCLQTRLVLTNSFLLILPWLLSMVIIFVLLQGRKCGLMWPRFCYFFLTGSKVITNRAGFDKSSNLKNTFNKYCLPEQWTCWECQYFSHCHNTILCIAHCAYVTIKFTECI